MKKCNYKIDRKKEKEKGITLVALVITVVVMLILAGVAIAAVVDGDGLFSKTRQAAETYENATRNEGDTIQSMINQIDEYLGEKNPPVNEEPIVNPINQIVSVNQTYSGGTTGSYNAPIIPKGFAPVNEGNAIWGSADGYQKGLVITDGVTGTESTGNEFVWVPVDGTNVTFARQDWRNSEGKLLTYPADTTIGEDTGTQYTETVLPAIETSVTKNGGFYIARYEAGLPDGEPSSSVAIDGTVKPVSKQGATVWNEIAWSDNGTNDDENPGDGAVTVARSMYPDNPDSRYGAVSTLIYGTQWDTALKFIGAYGGDTTYATDSTGKGNYSGITNDPISGLGTCGADPTFSQKNIYDMAGNVYEWTMEKYSTNRVDRGGDYNYGSGSDDPASGRGSRGVDHGSSGIRFSRSALYKVDLNPKEKRSN